MSNDSKAPFVGNVFFKGPEGFKEHFQYANTDAVAFAEARKVILAALQEIGATPDGPSYSKPASAVEGKPPANGQVFKLSPKGHDMAYKSGTSKQGKPYAGYFCTVKGCDEKEWA